MRVAVIVLGPLDRSPRMLNHVTSLAENTKLNVDFIGYQGSSMPKKLEDYGEQIQLVYLSTSLIDMLKSLPKIFYLFYAVTRIVYQVFQLYLILLFGSYDYILVQNPPCIPLFFVLFAVKMVKSYQLIIDWHNYGYTIMESCGTKAPICSMARLYELFFGKYGDHHLTVSHAFARDLASQLGIPVDKVGVLHDRAVEGKFRAIEKSERKAFLERVGIAKGTKDETVIMISSTSYTPDEDLSMLVECLKLLSQKQKENSKLPNFHLVVTGSGPMKKHFLKVFEQFNKENDRIKIEAKWLEIDDYPKMVASADLGICMHMSSSGLDLPMKVVDMFSCKVPCFAYQYPAIDELVKPSQLSKTKGANESHLKVSNQPNGALFRSKEDLLELFMNHFKDGGASGLTKLESYRKNLDEFVGQTWENHWQDVMLKAKSKGGTTVISSTLLKK